MNAPRLWSACALLLALAALVLAVVGAVSSFPNGVTVLLCLVLAVCAAWFGARRRGITRSVALGVALLLLAGAVVLVVVEGQLLVNILVLAAVTGSLAAARMAFRVHVQHPAVSAPSHPVLFYNPRSGGGKAARFDLPKQARLRGIDPIELQAGDDLEQLVRAAVKRGADGLAMAGGDGSQAIVAMIAAELDLPYACIPAGTRNHFALDLGVDRDDVVGALDAFVNGGERCVDLAEVNGRVFVNNVSLGLYADAVQRPGYREAKLHTLLDTVPSALGPEAAPPTLAWRAPGGRQSAVAILISNNAYRLGRALGSGTRPRLDRGVLGITVLAPLARGANGLPRRTLTMQQWSAEAFEISGDGPVPAGIDGEALELDSPLRFRARPRALRVRIAPQHPGASPSALEPDTAWQTIEALAGFALHGEPADLLQARSAVVSRSPDLDDDRAWRSRDARRVHQRKENSMPVVGADTHETLSGISAGDADVLDQVIGLREANREGSGLDERTFALVKIASLIALDAPPASYAWQVGMAIEAGVTPEDILGVLRAIAPQVGGPKVIAAAPEVMVALGLAID